MDWHEKTEQLLARRRRQGWTIEEIAEASGLSVGWLYKFGGPSGYPGDPSIGRVQQLHDTLKVLGSHP